MTRRADQEQELRGEAADETSLEEVSSRFDRGEVLSPQEREEALLADIERYLEAHPERGTALIKAVVNRAEAAAKSAGLGGQGSMEPTLNLREAGERIGISDVRVLQLFREGRLGTEVYGRPRFSEHECDEYRQNRRGPGRPPKSPEPPSKNT